MRVSQTSLTGSSVYSDDAASPSEIHAANFPRTPTAPLSRQTSNSSGIVTTTRGGRQIASLASSLSSNYSLDADPALWGSLLSPRHIEDDDYLHNPEPKMKNELPGVYGNKKNPLDSRGMVFTRRGFANLGCIAILGLGLVALFAGYPLASYFTTHSLSSLGGFNLGGINATGQIPILTGSSGLIDADTPASAMTMISFNDNNEEYELVFSDEFNTDGRSFYPGDDPYWEAADLNYWATGNLEWYDPAAVTTANGALKITLSEKETHGLHYQGGMISSWNKFCFTGGLLVTSVTLPGINNVAGFWPAVWTMGNLGRAGYGASLEGMWPYSYDSCDVGTVANQTLGGLPAAATIGGDPTENGELSFLPGQRLSRCTCAGESHPGPVHSDGTYVGRSAPEIDLFEATIDGKLGGAVSQSGQWAPFNQGYNWFNTTENQIIADDSITYHNTYQGGVFQETTSAVTKTNPDCYELGTGCFSTYAFEYKPGFDGAYISWVTDGKLAWTVNSGGLAADPAVEISARPIPQEPMASGLHLLLLLYLIANLGISPSFGFIDFEHLTFPATMSIDYIRVYQPKNAKNVGCDPKDFPTQAYINEYIEAYTNYNLTTWVDDFHQTFPKNSFLGECNAT
ncbi:glycoside hydrolase family 16 protein [Mycena floridula]|nr:glycoside hydrolase family 16 protein [Mycena floridula]